MIVVKVELWSAITGIKTELARMTISNDGTSLASNLGNYEVATVRGRDEATLNKNMSARVHTRNGRVVSHRKDALHVWHLVAKALRNVDYGGQ